MSRKPQLRDTVPSIARDADAAGMSVSTIVKPDGRLLHHYTWEPDRHRAERLRGGTGRQHLAVLGGL